MTHCAISIDPGLQATGVTIWKSGEPTALLTINQRRDADREEKMLHLQAELWRIVTENGPKWVAIEKPEDFYPPERKSSMIPLGIAIGICYGIATIFGSTVIMQRKGSIPKAQANMLTTNISKQPSSQHARDALLIGYLANLDRLTR